MDIRLNGKTALVCGSTQGIGNAAAQVLASMGASVILLARNKEKLEQAIKLLPVVEDAQHSYLVADFADVNSVKAAVDLLKDRTINILINNTGGPPSGPIVTAKAEEFLQAFNNHLICNHLLTQAVIPGMKSSGYGRIINVISTSVKIPLKNLGVSNTIRAAVANWSKTMANELASFQITVNNVLPGATHTQRLQSIMETKSANTKTDFDEVQQEMINEIPMKRFAKPEEVANAIAFLASPSASYITGINIPVDGGRTGSL